jgi:hypothetical protein
VSFSKDGYILQKFEENKIKSGLVASPLNNHSGWMGS